MNDYLSVADIAMATTDVVGKYPGLAHLVALPEITFEGRTCHALHLSKSPRAGQDCILIIAGVHAAEWGSCEIALNFADRVLAAHKAHQGLTLGAKTFTSQQMQDLLDHRDLMVFPLVNPDGRQRSRGELGMEMWRKNRNTGNPGSDGVDLNRNFDFLFHPGAFAQGSGLSASGNPLDSLYRGPGPFSEAETQNVRWLLDKFDKIRWFLDLHCTGPTIRYVWNDDEAQDDKPGMTFRDSDFDGKRGLPLSAAGNTVRDDYREFLHQDDLAAMQKLAQRFVTDLMASRDAARGSERAYTSGPAFQFNPFSGTSHDYAFSRHLVDSSKSQVLSFYVEWGSFIHPDWDEMEKIIAEVTAGLIGFCLETQENP